MRLVSFLRPDGTMGCGRLEGERVADLAVPGMRALLASGLLADTAVNREWALADIRLLPPVPYPGKILCIGLNYAAHVAEMGRTSAGHPAVFTRWSDTLVAHGAPLVIPRESKMLDYEGELAVVIGRGGRRIPAERAFDHIAGYTVFNDASVRDWQNHASQFTPGKNFPGTAACGPALVTADEVGDPTLLRVETRLNGTVMQDQPVSDLIHSIPALIAYLSSFTELKPGDIIATGTPSGVGHGRKPPVYLAHGDTVSVTIGLLGTLTNPVVAEQ
jgi:2-keto-4-pentenoate hydratase/2-oxohepta-3-ene-1,7-dioic acid hydratase in catechol pathway